MKDATQRLIEEIVAEESHHARSSGATKNSTKEARGPQRISVQARVPSSNDAPFVASAVMARSNSLLKFNSDTSKSPTRKARRSRRIRRGLSSRRRAVERIRGLQSWDARRKAAVEGSAMRQAQAQRVRSSKLGIHAHLKAIYGGK